MLREGLRLLWESAQRAGTGSSSGRPVVAERERLPASYSEVVSRSMNRPALYHFVHQAPQLHERIECHLGLVLTR